MADVVFFVTMEITKEVIDSPEVLNEIKFFFTGMEVEVISSVQMSKCRVYVHVKKNDMPRVLCDVHLNSCKLILLMINTHNHTLIQLLCGHNFLWLNDNDTW